MGRILGIAGKKGVGKTTLARQLYLRDGLGYVLMDALAEPIKVICRSVLGLSYEQVYGTDDQKNTPTRYHLADLLGDDTEYAYATARQVMQILGTEIFRKHFGDNIWVEALVRRHEESRAAITVVHDVRFPNEVARIQESGGRVIHLTTSRDPGAHDSHVSETALDHFQGFDAAIDRTNLHPEQVCDQAVDLLRRWGWLPG